MRASFVLPAAICETCLASAFLFGALPMLPQPGDLQAHYAASGSRLLEAARKVNGFFIFVKTIFSNFQNIPQDFAGAPSRSYPSHRSTGRRGYFGYFGSVRERSHR